MSKTPDILKGTICTISKGNCVVAINADIDDGKRETIMAEMSRLLHGATVVVIGAINIVVATTDPGRG